jgi:hypothetical protein
VITADGELKVANKVSNPDLFWALKGGGGGTFGIVTEATVKAHIHVPITVYAWWLNSTASIMSAMFAPPAGFKDGMEHLFTQLPVLGEQGVSAYLYKASNSIRGVALTVGKNATAEYAKSVWDPILKKMSSFPGMLPHQYKIFQFPNYQEFFDVSYGKEGMCMPKRGLSGTSCAPGIYCSF